MVGWRSATELLIFGLMAGEAAGLVSGSPRSLWVGGQWLAGQVRRGCRMLVSRVNAAVSW
jgi:hypothetical protein